MRANQDLIRIATLRIVALLLTVCLLMSCSGNNGFPSDAQDVLDDTARTYYTSPWLSSTPFQVLYNVEITDAWKAKGEENGEMWCAELEISGRQADRSNTISAVWIIVRQDDQSIWQAAALETISASTTIERCEL